MILRKFYEGLPASQIDRMLLPETNLCNCTRVTKKRFGLFVAADSKPQLYMTSVKLCQQ
jgi:hypothetical protein